MGSEGRCNQTLHEKANHGACSYNTPVEFGAMQSWPWGWARSWAESPDEDINVSPLLNCIPCLSLSLSLFFFFFHSSCSHSVLGIQFIKTHTLVLGMLSSVGFRYPWEEEKWTRHKETIHSLWCIWTYINLMIHKEWNTWKIISPDACGFIAENLSFSWACSHSQDVLPPSDSLVLERVISVGWACLVGDLWKDLVMKSLKMALREGSWGGGFHLLLEWRRLLGTTRSVFSKVASLGHKFWKVTLARKRKKRKILVPFLGLHLQHMEVPRLGVELEPPAYTTATATPDL